MTWANVRRGEVAGWQLWAALAVGTPVAAGTVALAVVVVGTAAPVLGSGAFLAVAIWRAVKMHREGWGL